MTVRGVVVDAVIAGLANMDNPAELDGALQLATREEVAEAVARLAAAAEGGCRPCPEVLALTYTQTLRLAHQGVAFAQVIAYLGSAWGAGPAPHQGLGTILKVQEPHRVSWVRDKLAAVGLALDDETGRAVDGQPGT